MDYFVDAAKGDSMGETAMAELLRPVEQSERLGGATPAPSPEKYTYFFVPAMSGDTADVLASDAFGAFLRLGSYSDIEEAARDIRPQADHYPRHHLRDEGGADAALSQASGGQQGIMLACDGRILLRSKEKMYVDSGDYDQYTSGNYDLEVEGAMRLATTESPGGITISSAQDTLVLESGPGQDITISAGDGTGNFKEQANTSTTTFLGSEFTMTEGARFSHIEAAQFKFFAGGTITTSLAANLYMNAAADLYFRIFFYLVSYSAVDIRLCYQDIAKYDNVVREYELSDSMKRSIWKRHNCKRVDGFFRRMLISAKGGFKNPTWDQGFGLRTIYEEVGSETNSFASTSSKISTNDNDSLTYL